MERRPQWLEWIVELQALAQAGLEYGRDKYDLERYERIREISAEMLAGQAGLPLETVKGLFCNETGYQTPKLDTRAAIFQGDKILGENTVKEVREEAGLDVTADLVIALQDRNRHNAPPSIYGICKVFVLCSLLGGSFQPNLETLDSGYFALDELPELAVEKTTAEQISMCFDAYHADRWTTLLD